SRAGAVHRTNRGSVMVHSGKLYSPPSRSMARVVEGFGRSPRGLYFLPTRGRLQGSGRCVRRQCYVLDDRAGEKLTAGIRAAPAGRGCDLRSSCAATYRIIPHERTGVTKLPAPSACRSSGGSASPYLLHQGFEQILEFADLRLDRERAVAGVADVHGQGPVVA